MSDLWDHAIYICYMSLEELRQISTVLLKKGARFEGPGVKILDERRYKSARLDSKEE